MSRWRVVAALATTCVALGLLELGPLRYAAGLLGPGELDILRAWAWPVAVVAGLAVLGASRATVTDPRALQQAVADRDWLRGLLDAMAEGVVAFDRQGRVVFANPAALELLGVRGLPDGTPMVAFSEIPRLRSTVVRALRGNEAVTRELEVPGPPARTVVLRTTPTRHGAVAVLLDVSAIRKIERSWRDFAANASHELRTPAAAVMANLEAAVEAPDELRERFLASALRQSQRLGRLVSDLMDLVRIESGQLDVRAEPVVLADLIRACIEEQETAHSDATGRIATACSVDVVALADTSATRQVLANLLSNALRYTDGPVVVAARPEGRMVRLEVRDQGPGIEAAQRERIFDRFYRVDEGRSRAMGGSGLGLSIVRELVDAMGGRVGIDDNEPAGLVMWAELPRSATPRDARTAPPP